MQWDDVPEGERIYALPELKRLIKRTPLDDLNRLEGLVVAYPVDMSASAPMRTKLLPGFIIGLETMTSCMICHESVMAVYLTADEDGDWILTRDQYGTILTKPKLDDIFCHEHLLMVQALGDLVEDYLKRLFHEQGNPFRFRPPFGQENQN